MINRFHTLTGAALLALAAPHAIAADDAWTMDFAAAKATAAEAGKDLLLEFTGSDWCPPCQRLNSEVFSQEAFLTAAPEHFVLVKLDFPNDKSGLSEEIQEQNDALAQQYGIGGFPTIILTDADGRPYAQTGFRQDGPEEYVAHLKTLQENRVSRDEAFASAAEAEGVEKAKLLVSALDAMGLEPETVGQFYGGIVEEIKANDPEDETGFTRRAAIQGTLEEFHQQINALAGTGNFEGILPLIDNVLETEGLTPDQKQEITLTRALVFAELGQFDNAIKVVDEAAEIAPDSQIAPMLEGFKDQLTQARDAQNTEE